MRSSRRLTTSKNNFVFSSKKTKSKSSLDTSQNLHDQTDVTAVQSDLLTIGIDVDEGLIRRLQSLGVGKVFTAATKTASIVKSRQKIPEGAVPEIEYRHNEEHKEKPVVSDVLLPWDGLSFQVDCQRLSTLWKDICNTQGQIDSKIRALLENMIHNFHVQYLRCPSRFVRGLLGLPYSKLKHKNEDIQGLILKTRFVNEETFLQMIERVYPSVDIELSKALFKILCEEKEFGSTKSIILDLWLFLALLKTASVEARRSYDSKTTKVALEVEFWQKSNNDKHRTPSAILEKQGSTARISSKGIIVKERICKRGSDSCELLQQKDWKVQASEIEEKVRGKENVSTLVGNPEYIPDAVVNQGRKVAGRFFNESINAIDVSMALRIDENPLSEIDPNSGLSTQRAKTLHPRKKISSSTASDENHRLQKSPDKRRENDWSSIFEFPGSKSGASFDGIAAAAALSCHNFAFDSNSATVVSKTQPNIDAHNSHLQKLVDYRGLRNQHSSPQSGSNPQFRLSSHILAREQYQKNSSVAQVLGCTDRPRSASANPRISRQTATRKGDMYDILTGGL